LGAYRGVHGNVYGQKEQKEGRKEKRAKTGGSINGDGGFDQT
jgi:hypothetical protein